MIYEQLRDRIKAEHPVALATVIDGPTRGAKLLVAPGEPVQGSLGDPRPTRNDPDAPGRHSGRPSPAP